MKLILAFATLLAFSAISQAQTIHFVRAGADPDAADGTTWNTAFPDLNDALAAAQYGEEIWICAGTYKPTAGTNRYLTFTLPNGVRLYGGFAGTETSRQQRNWSANLTILSGELGAPGNADNSYGILYAAQCDTTTTVDGLIFENGNANNPDDVGVFSHERTQSGAAIYLNGMGSGKFAYLNIYHCTFRNNHSDYYGSVYANGRDNGHCAIQASHCEFYHNTSDYAGGGLVVENYYGPQYPTTIAHSAFHDNFAVVHGGALFLVHHGDVQVLDCSFTRDSILYSAGGAIGIKGSEMTGSWLFEDCTFHLNKVGNAGSAGAVMTVEIQNSTTDFTFRRCFFSKNNGADGIFVPTIYSSLSMLFEQCVFRENQTNNFLYDLTASCEAKFEFAGCLFFNNAGREIFSSATPVSQFKLYNCIIAQNDASPELANNNAPVLMDHCLVSQSDCVALGAAVSCGPGMLYGLDPQFADPANGDFHLLPCSPALDAGDDSAALALGISKDLDGHARFADAAIDLGPFENDRFLVPTTLQPASCTGVSDGSVSFAVNACAPYELSWTNDAGQSGANINGLPAGTYHFLLNDPNGFSDSATVTIGAPPPLEIFTSIVPASGPLNADGAVVVDSARGGTPPYPWTDGEPLNGLSNLLPGNYPVTLTDSWGCAVAFVFEVGFVSGTSETEGAARVRLTPNPTPGGGSAHLFFEPEQLTRVTLHDARGRNLAIWEDPAGTQLDVEAILPPGAYFFEIQDKKGRSRSIPWLIQ